MKGSSFQPLKDWFSHPVSPWMGTILLRRMTLKANGYFPRPEGNPELLLLEHSVVPYFISSYNPSMGIPLRVFMVSCPLLIHYTRKDDTSGKEVPYFSVQSSFFSANG
jgi:hypothetical protein